MTDDGIKYGWVLVAMVGRFPRAFAYFVSFDGFWTGEPELAAVYSDPDTAAEYAKKRNLTTAVPARVELP